MAEAFPDAKVLLSTRDADSWWESANRTIFPTVAGLDADSPFRPYLMDLFKKTGTRMDDRDSSLAAFDAHNEAVRAAFGPDRLIEWCPGDGWEPLCTALGVDEPGVPFPHANSSGGYQEMISRARAGDVPRYAEPLPPVD